MTADSDLPLWPLIAVLGRLPLGATELGCHPGEGNLPETMYVRERSDEVKSLCDPRVRQAVRGLGIELISFRDIGRQVSP